MNVLKGYVYKMVSLDGSLVYIGSSCKDPRKRYASHRHCAKSGKMPYLSLLFAQGLPTISLLEVHTNVERSYLREREQYFLDQYGSMAVNKNRASFDKAAYDKRQREDVECEVCGKNVQRVYLNRHMKGDKCRYNELWQCLKEFGRLPCQRARRRVPRNGQIMPDAQPIAETVMPDAETDTQAVPTQ